MMSVAVHVDGRHTENAAAAAAALNFTCKFV